MSMFQYFSHFVATSAVCC